MIKDDQNRIVEGFSSDFKLDKDENIAELDPTTYLAL